MEPRGAWQYWESSERVLALLGVCVLGEGWTHKNVTWENVSAKSLPVGAGALLWDNCSCPVSEELYGTSWGWCQPCPASLGIGTVQGLGDTGDSGLTLHCHRQLLSRWQAENSSSSNSAGEILVENCFKSSVVSLVVAHRDRLQCCSAGFQHPLTSQRLPLLLCSCCATSSEEETWLHLSSRAAW